MLYMYSVFYIWPIICILSISFYMDWQMAISWSVLILQRPLQNKLQATEYYINRSSWY